MSYGQTSRLKVWGIVCELPPASLLRPITPRRRRETPLVQPIYFLIHTRNYPRIIQLRDKLGK